MFFLCKQVSITGSFLARDRSLCPPPPLSTGTSSGLNQYRPCGCCHSLCEFICASILSCLGDTVSWSHAPPRAHTNLSPSPLCIFLNYEGEGMKTSLLSQSVPKSVSLCIMSRCESPCEFLSTARAGFCDDG